MSNEILNSLLKEYEQKRLKAEINSEKRKKELYLKYPRLKDIELELNSFAINTAKNILNNTSTSLDELHKKIDLLKKEKKYILTQANISDEYLLPYYECNLCNDTGYISKNYKTTMCPCLKQKLLNISYNNSNISNFDLFNFNNFNELLFSDEVDIAKYKYNISPRKNIINIKNKCEDFIKNFDDPTCKNLLFSGSTGLR
jgi:DNA replication protein DnaC